MGRKKKAKKEQANSIRYRTTLARGECFECGHWHMHGGNVFGVSRMRALEGRAQ